MSAPMTDAMKMINAIKSAMISIRRLAYASSINYYLLKRVNT